MEVNDEDFLKCITLETEMINDVDDMWLFLWFENVILVSWELINTNIQSFVIGNDESFHQVHQQKTTFY